MAEYVGALDQGTTSNRIIIFDHNGKIVDIDQKEHEHGDQGLPLNWDHFFFIQSLPPVPLKQRRFENSSASCTITIHKTSPST